MAAASERQQQFSAILLLTIKIMRQETKGLIIATTTLVGTIIGVGIFSVPYALSQAGVGIGLAYFVVLGGIQLLQHLFYAEAAIATPEKLRLVGLTEKYLGKRAKHIAAVSAVLGFWGGMLAYMIVGGTFLHTILAPYFGGSVFAYQIGWALVGAGAIYFGLGFISKIDFFATLGLVGAMLLIFALGAPHVQVENLPWFVGKDLFLPYGVILFSLSGLPAITEMEDILEGKHRKYRLAVVLGTLIAVALTATFGYIVWGVTGGGTTQDAVSGLAAVLGTRVTILAAVFGFLAVATSFFATAINLQSTFEYDYKLPHASAWFLTGAVPFVLLIAGIKDFVKIVSFSGAVFGGITAVLVAMLYIAIAKRRAVKVKPLGAPLWLAYVSIAILSVGAVYETLMAARGLV